MRNASWIRVAVLAFLLGLMVVVARALLPPQGGAVAGQGGTAAAADAPQRRGAPQAKERPKATPRAQQEQPARPPDAKPPAARPPAAPAHQRVYRVPGIRDYPMPRVRIPYRHYPRPYYIFLPRFWLGFGLYMGYALPYPVIYGYPPYIYDAGGIEVLTAAPPIALYGGISFDLTPDDALVIVDDTELGMARDFGPSEQPLTLRPGWHHIELRAPGMEPVAFDVQITAGHVLPFQGALQPR